MTDLTRQIIDFSARDEGSEARQAFYAALHDKVTAHIEAHKKDIAQNLISPESRMAIQATDTPTEAPVESE